MTNEELQALELSEEQIKAVFKINGKDVEKAKGDLTTKETELANVTEQLEQANTQIEEFQGLDVEGIKKASEEYKAKFEEAKSKAESDIADLKFEHELESLIRDSKAKNVKAVKALLDVEVLRGSNNRTEDVKTAIETVKTENDYMFGEAGLSGTTPNNTGGSGGGKNPWSKEHFNLTEQARIIREDPSLAQQLKTSK